MSNYIGDVAPLICAIFALLWCRLTKRARTKALFIKIVAAGIVCAALGHLHNLVYSLITESQARIYISFLGIVGFYFFLLSASYGQVDGIFDDGSKACRKVRLIALVAPAGIHLIILPILLSGQIPLWMKIITYLGWLPIFFASYYNLKHALLPDNGFTFVKAVRPYNIVAVVLEYLQAIYLTMRTLGIDSGFAIVSVLLGLSILCLMYFARKGASLWTI